MADLPVGRSERWVFYTLEVAPVGTKGPFGPFTATDEDAAVRIALARAASSGLHLGRVQRLEPDTEASDA